MIENTLVQPRSREFTIPNIKHILLAVVALPILSGALPIIGKFSGLGLRGLWLGYCILICLIARSLPIRRLLYPLWPYFAWLCCYLALGVTVSPTPALPLAMTILFYTVIFAITIAVFLSDLNLLHFFANCTQWILVLNLLFLLLVIRYPSLQSIVTPDAMVGEAYEVAKERFAGLWGNPNMAGYICIIVILLSTWATRWIAWVGRLSGVSIIYLSASRKASIFLLIIVLMNIIIVQRRNIKTWILCGASALIVVASFLLYRPRTVEPARALSNDRKINRIVDITESRTGSNESRLDLFKHWIPIASAAPLYGYGLGAMAGYDAKGQITRKELFIVGTHNTYLGIWIDVGPFGFLAFLIVFSVYIYRYLVAKFEPPIRWTLLSMMVCNCLILAVSHSHLFCAEGILAFSMYFLLPTSPALMASRC